MLTLDEAVTKYKEARAAYGYDISEFVNEPKHAYQTELERRALLAGDALDAAVCDAMLAAVCAVAGLQRGEIAIQARQSGKTAIYRRAEAAITAILAAFQRVTGE